MYFCKRKLFKVGKHCKVFPEACKLLLGNLFAVLNIKIISRREGFKSLNSNKVAATNFEMS